MYTFCCSFHVHVIYTHLNEIYIFQQNSVTTIVSYIQIWVQIVMLQSQRGKDNNSGEGGQDGPVQRAQWISKSVTVAKSFLLHRGHATSGRFLLTTSPGANQFFPSEVRAGRYWLAAETGAGRMAPGP